MDLELQQVLRVLDSPPAITLLADELGVDEVDIDTSDDSPLDPHSAITPPDELGDTVGVDERTSIQRMMRIMR